MISNNLTNSLFWRMLMIINFPHTQYSTVLLYFAEIVVFSAFNYNYTSQSIVKLILNYLISFQSHMT